MNKTLFDTGVSAPYIAVIPVCVPMSFISELVWDFAKLSIPYDYIESKNSLASTSQIISCKQISF